MNHFPLEIFRWTDPFQTKAQYFVLQAPPFDLIAEVVCYYPFQGGDDLWSFCIKNHALANVGHILPVEVFQPLDLPRVGFLMEHEDATLHLTTLLEGNSPR